MKFDQFLCKLSQTDVRIPVQLNFYGRL
jgi:hypothetical protein